MPIALPFAPQLSGFPDDIALNFYLGYKETEKVYNALNTSAFLL